jgi:hypothetical protein
MFGLISCSKKERKKQVCVILEEGAYLQVSKVKKKKSLPTDPNFEDHAIGNTVEVGNGEEFPDFVDLLFFLA